MSWKTPQRNRMDFLSSSSGEESELTSSCLNHRITRKQQETAEGRVDFGKLSTAISGINLEDRNLGQRDKSFLALESSDESDGSSLLNCTPTFKRKTTNHSSKEATDDDCIEKTKNDPSVPVGDGDPEMEKFSWFLDRVRNEYSIDSKRGIGSPNFKIPKSLFQKLYDHQKAGVLWMAGLHEQCIGGLLGYANFNHLCQLPTMSLTIIIRRFSDDMGMGKTYQTLTFLGGLMRARTIRNALIVAPLSVLDSWRKEADNVVKLCVPAVNIKIVSSDVSRKSRLRHLNDALKW